MGQRKALTLAPTPPPPTEGSWQLTSQENQAPGPSPAESCPLCQACSSACVLRHLALTSPGLPQEEAHRAGQRGTYTAPRGDLPWVPHSLWTFQRPEVTNKEGQPLSSAPRPRCALMSSPMEAPQGAGDTIVTTPRPGTLPLKPPAQQVGKGAGSDPHHERCSHLSTHGGLSGPRSPAA